MRIQRLLLAVVLLGRGVAQATISLANEPVAAAPVPIEITEHPGFGRIVFDFTQPVTWHLTRDGEQVTLNFDDTGPIGEAPSRPRNVVAIDPGTGLAEITVIPGARIRTMAVQDRLVVDVLDPVRPGARRESAMRPSVPIDRHDTPPAQSETASSSPAVAPAVALAAKPSQPPPVDPPPIVNPVAVASTEPVQSAPELTNPAPATLASAKLPTAPGAAGPAILLPFEASVGAAAFRRGTVAVLVFDQPRPLDLAPLRNDPVFGAAAVHLRPDATLVTLPVPATGSVTLQREPAGWRVMVGAAPEHSQPIVAAQTDRRLEFPAANLGRIVNIVDPESGGVLLVGTQREAGQGVAVGYRAPQFVLLPSWQGVAIEPLSDQVVLRVVPHGFALTSAGQPLAMTATEVDKSALTQAATLTRRFQFPSLPTAAMASQLRQQMAAAATAPPLARGALQRAVAETLIALGLGPEAQAVMRVAVTENPAETDAPDNAGLAAIAALLSGRPEQAAAIANPALSGTDEMTLWRAVRQADLHGDATAAAADFAATWPLILTYGAALRDRLLPLATETMIRGGQTAQAAAVLSARPGDKLLALARGMLAELQGNADAALTTYDALAVGRDRLVRIRAARRAVELRLASGRIDAGHAADALETLLFAWRGDDREADLRDRLAALRAQAGRWADALGLLRDTARDFPDRQDVLRERMKQLFTASLADPRTDALPPLEFVSLVDANADLLPGGPAGDDLQSRLADRLLALDLPRPASQLLEKLMRAAPSGLGRAGFGARLATLRLNQGDATGAMATLSDSAAADLPAALAENRTLTLADAQARSGDVAGAVAALSGLGSAAADERRAAILERAQDWPAAEAALKDYAAKTVPEAGTLDDAQRRTMVRLAAAAARIGDDGAIAMLRTRDVPRMGTGPLADMFRLLTADPVRALTDLKRSGQEAVLAHALPEDIKSVR